MSNRKRKDPRFFDPHDAFDEAPTDGPDAAMDQMHKDQARVQEWLHRKTGGKEGMPYDVAMKHFQKKTEADDRHRASKLLEANRAANATAESVPGYYTRSKKRGSVRKPAKKNPDGLTYTEYLAAHGLERSPRWLGNWKRGEHPNAKSGSKHAKPGARIETLSADRVTRLRANLKRNKPKNLLDENRAANERTEQTPGYYMGRKHKPKAKHTAKEKAGLRKATAAERLATKLEKKAKTLAAKGKTIKTETAARAAKRREAERKSRDAAATAKAAAKRAREAKAAARRAAR